MAKVTSKLQFTLPKKLAEQVGISPGDEVDVSLAGEGLRIEWASDGIAVTGGRLKI